MSPGRGIVAGCAFATTERCAFLSISLLHRLVAFQSVQLAMFVDDPGFDDCCGEERKEETAIGESVLAHDKTLVVASPKSLVTSVAGELTPSIGLWVRNLGTLCTHDGGNISCPHDAWVIEVTFARRRVCPATRAGLPEMSQRHAEFFSRCGRLRRRSHQGSRPWEQLSPLICGASLRAAYGLARLTNQYITTSILRAVCVANQTIPREWQCTNPPIAQARRQVSGAKLADAPLRAGGH